MDEKRVSEAVLRQLTPQEQARGAAYVTTAPVAAGTRLAMRPATSETEWPCYVAFVDREPLANWGHSCRYILIGAEAAQTRSIEARFPPPRDGALGAIRLVHRGEAVPDIALLVPP